MKAWKIGLIIGLVWGLICAYVLYTFPEFSIIWLAIGYIGGRILLVMTDMTFKFIAPLFHANPTQLLHQFGWILFPIWGGIILSALGYVLDKIITIWKSR